MIGANLTDETTAATIGGMDAKPYRRDWVLPRPLLRAVLDAMNPAHSADASRAYELLSDLENASADISVLMTDDEEQG